MTGRERVRTALNHQEPDRVPIDFASTRVSGIAATAYRRLLDHLGMQEEVRVYDIKQQLAQPSTAMIERMGGDIVQLQRLGPTTGMPFLELDQWKPGCMTDGSPCLVPAAYHPVVLNNGDTEIRRDGILHARRTPAAPYFDVCPFPLANAESCADIDLFVWPDPWTEREELWLQSQVHKLRDNTDKAIFAGLPMLCSSFFEIGAVLFGYQRFMENLLLNRDMMEHWLDVKLEHDCAILDKFLSVAGPYIEAIQASDDFGAQNALLIRPQLYREMFKPRQQRWIEFVKARTQAKIFLHCDGAVATLIPDFIEIGIDILNPLQTSARGMDPATLKREYGRHLSFWGGGVDTQSTLPFGTLEDIRREVKERIQLLAPGGGFVFTTIHNIQPDISPERILAVFDTAGESGAYPISNFGN